MRAAPAATNARPPPTGDVSVTLRPAKERFVMNRRKGAGAAPAAPGLGHKLPPMPIKMRGAGHAVGAATESNERLAESLGLKADWFTKRTGISERRVSGPGQDVITLAGEAVRAACADARVASEALGKETVFIHIQNGGHALAPPAAIQVASHLGLSNVRIHGIDGVCAEPIVALEEGALLLTSGRCDRVIVSAAVDFMDWVDDHDLDTVGLFGAGAGALVLERAGEDEQASLISLHWETHPEYAKLGAIRVLDVDRGGSGVTITTGYYEMDGAGLARAALEIVPPVIDTVLAEAGWAKKDVDLMVTHQPNARLLEIGVRRMHFDPAVVPMPVRLLGNMGPASLLVNLSLAKQAHRMAPGSKILLVAFGLGFSCGAAALVA
jgi:3-oxoacyl-[acyl-carrier-protein] synthase III